MSGFNKTLLEQIKNDLLEKSGFVPSQQMQEQILQAQQEGLIPPSEPPVDPSAQQIGLQEIAGMTQEGINAVLQGQQQIVQMLQQIMSVVQQSMMAGSKGKRLSANERLDKLEEMLQSLVGGGAPPMGDPTAMGGGAPPADPSMMGGGAMPPEQVDPAAQPPQA